MHACTYDLFLLIKEMCNFIHIEEKNKNQSNKQQTKSQINKNLLPHICYQSV